MQLTKEDGRAIIARKHPDWTLVERLQPTDDEPDVKGGVYEHVKTRRTYMFHWTIGPNGLAYEDGDPDPQEVRAMPNPDLPFPGPDEDG